MQLLIDPATGKLSPNDPPMAGPGVAGAGPRHMAFHPSRKWAYVINELNGTITSYSYDATRGTLSEPQSLRTTPEGFTENASAHVVVHPGGRFVYASNRAHNSLAVFAIDDTSGRPRLVTIDTAEGMIRTPRDFTLDPNGAFALVANQGSGTLLVLRIGADGRLTRVGMPITGLGGPQWVGAVTLP
jgi:6-phosphogluconolactonase